MRVAAYCRVSTDFEEQESSYETQVAHYTSYINGNSEWEMVEVYADNGLSGTRTAKREAFNRMMLGLVQRSRARLVRNNADFYLLDNDDPPDRGYPNYLMQTFELYDNSFSINLTSLSTYG